jgi:AcrR family transcriptional regulator
MRDTSLSAVAARAGVSRPTVYKHVGDVAAVARAVVDRELERFFGALADELAGTVPGDGPLSGAIGFAVAHARAHPLLQRLLQLEPDAILPVFTVAAAPVLRRAVGVLAPVLGGRRERRGSRPRPGRRRRAARAADDLAGDHPAADPGPRRRRDPAAARDDGLANPGPPAASRRAAGPRPRRPPRT